jgi:hypothetical protein
MGASTSFSSTPIDQAPDFEIHMPGFPGLPANKTLVLKTIQKRQLF